MSRPRGKRGGKNRGNKGQERNQRTGSAMLPVVRQNAMLQGSGANTRQDRGAGQTYASSTVNPYFLNNYVRRNQEYLRMYNTSWEVQKTITIPVDDALKYRAELKGLDEKDAKLIWEVYDEKQLDQQNRRSFIQERLFGGCVQYGVFKRGKMEGVDQPLRMSQRKPGDFEAINVIDVTRLSVAEWVDDPFSADYDRPLDYRIIGHPVDKSRLIVFDGQSIVSKATRNVLEAGRYNPLGFGESKLSTLYDILRFCTGSQEGAYHLVNLSSVLLVEAENLRMMKATNSRAYEALEAIIEQISIYRGAVLDGKGVKVSQHSATFGSVPELLMMYLQIYSAASDVPATRFLGQAPGGLNATGESDTQNYHDNIRSFQQQRVKPVQKRQIDWIGCDVWGWNTWRQKRSNLEITYPPLWSETAKEKADRTAIYAGLISNLYTSGMISGEAAVKELKAREAFATDIEASDFLDKGPELEGDPIDPNAPLKELEGMGGGQTNIERREAGKVPRNAAESLKRGIRL